VKIRPIISHNFETVQARR